jgi:hypothetical protein
MFAGNGGGGRRNPPPRRRRSAGQSSSPAFRQPKNEKMARPQIRFGLHARHVSLGPLSQPKQKPVHRWQLDPYRQARRSNSLYSSSLFRTLTSVLGTMAFAGKDGTPRLVSVRADAQHCPCNTAGLERGSARRGGPPRKRIGSRDTYSHGKAPGVAPPRGPPFLAAYPRATANNRAKAALRNANLTRLAHQTRTAEMTLVPP